MFIGCTSFRAEEQPQNVKLTNFILTAHTSLSPTVTFALSLSAVRTVVSPKSVPLVKFIVSKQIVV